MSNLNDLLPAERIAFVVALNRARRGEDPLPNIATTCIFALARILGEYDYTAVKAPPS